eukprot:10158939-Alexandrium_andersonii.AAC.1
MCIRDRVFSPPGQECARGKETAQALLELPGCSVADASCKTSWKLASVFKTRLETSARTGKLEANLFFPWAKLSP